MWFKNIFDSFLVFTYFLFSGTSILARLGITKTQNHPSLVYRRLAHTGCNDCKSCTRSEWTLKQPLKIKSSNVGWWQYSYFNVSINIQNFYEVLIGDDNSEATGQTLEYLIMNDSVRSNDCHVCRDTIPDNGNSHQIDVYRSQLMVAGGILDNLRGMVDCVWEENGCNEEQLRVKWIHLRPVLECICCHASVVIDGMTFYMEGRIEWKSAENTFHLNNTYSKNVHCRLIARERSICVVNQPTRQSFITRGFWNGDVVSKLYLFWNNKWFGKDWRKMLKNVVLPWSNSSITTTLAAY